MDSMRVPSRTVTPCCTRILRRAALTSASSLGTTVGSISTSVTSLPRSANNVAHSTPTAPAPATTICAGGSSSSNAPSLSITPGRSVPGTGGITDDEPLAMMTLGAMTRSPRSPISTSTTPAPASVP